MTTPVPPTPTGTPRPEAPPPRPRQDTATDYAEARQQLAETGQPARPELVEAKTAVNRLGRLEERQDRTDREISDIKSELRANTKTTSKGATWSQFAAVGGPVLLALLSSLGEWGNQHPEAKVGLVGVFLTIAGVFAKSKATTAAGAAAATAGTDQAPPGHS